LERIKTTLEIRKKRNEKVILDLRSEEKASRFGMCLEKNFLSEITANFLRRELEVIE
jgi:hypothetical protein